MKKIIFVCFLILFIGMQDNCLFAQQGKIITKQKKISKYYKVNPATDTLFIGNQFGAMHIHTWDKHEVVVHYVATGRANKDAQRAQTILDNIYVKDKKEPGKVLIGTNIKTPYNHNNGINGLAGEGRARISEAGVDCDIYMPKRMALNAENSNGVVYMDDFAGWLDIEIDWGCLHAKNITGPYYDTIRIQPNIDPVTGEGDRLNTISSIDKGMIEGDFGTLRITSPIDTQQVKITRFDTVISNGVIRSRWNRNIRLQ